MANHARSSINFVEFFKNALFPKFCFGCGKIGSYLCIQCSSSLKPVLHDMCPLCNKASFFGLTHPKCTKQYGLDGFISLFHYESLAKKIIVKMKYHLIYEAVEDIVGSIPVDSYKKILFYKKISPTSTLIPVPLHSKRSRDRGFNQSEKIFEQISKKAGIPMQTDVVFRQKYTIPQAHMKSKKERSQNIIGAFSVIKNVTGNDYIICDDVWTTGATIKELCRELKKNGARNVYALTIARVFM